jgi:hypothetical protein
MSRRIMIGLAAAVAMVALATAPAGAGAGNLEVYSAPNYSGTHVTVPPATVGSYVDTCVSVYTLTSAGLTTSQSMTNNTGYTLGLYGATGCSATSFITTVSAYSQWTTTTNQTVLSVRVTK